MGPDVSGENSVVLHLHLAKQGGTYRRVLLARCRKQRLNKALPKKKKISLKKSEVNWIFTLYSRTKITNNKKQLNALLVLCPHTELQYDCELAEKRAWLFHSDAHLEQYKRLIICVNAV